LSHEPGLRFWLRYVEREGGLVEDAGDHAVALLPASLQRDGGLAEEVVVTSDPATAGDEGAVLLIPGHHALESAANTVLEQGDAGRSFVAWPRSALPRASDFEHDARERFNVEHGRIDAAGEPKPVYLPLMRAGAMISYAASLTHRFQEQEEVWVDARTGLGVPERTLDALAGQARLPEPDTTRTALDADVPSALREAHALLEGRAQARQATLLIQARQALEAELDRTDAYYRGALDSIDRRRATAPPERVRLLDGQAEATRAEHARRRREIEEEFQATYEIRPFRLHLVLVPAYVVPVDVRRGARSYPLELVSLCPGRGRLFAELRCPHCSAWSDLVAGRERLGCRSCLGRPPIGGAAVSATGDSEGARSTGSPPGAASGKASDTRRRSAAEEKPPARSHRRGRPAKPPPRAPPRHARRERTHRPSGTSDRTASIGGKLATSFWETVAGGERWPKRKVVRNAPLGAVYRLYGAEGPLCAIGVAPGDWPTEVTAITYPHPQGSPHLTHGELRAGSVSYPFALHWRLEGGKPVVGEVMPGPHPAVLGPSSPDPAEAETSARLHERAPAPAIELDPVAAALWRTELAETGLPFAVRCLAIWWRVERHCGPHPPAAVAAAVASAVAKAAGLRRSRARASSLYASEPEHMKRVASDLGPHLSLDRSWGW